MPNSIYHVRKHNNSPELISKSFPFFLKKFRFSHAATITYINLKWYTFHLENDMLLLS